jgi:hypothetical protein
MEKKERRRVARAGKRARKQAMKRELRVKSGGVTPKLMERTERVTAAPWAGKSVRQMVAALEDSALNIAGVKETAKMCVFGIGQEKLLAVEKEP